MASHGPACTGSVTAPARPEDRWFSLNPAMVHSRQGRPVLETVPRHRLLLESDGPYLTRGTPPRPATGFDGAEVVQVLASRWAVPEDAVRRQLDANRRAWFPGWEPAATLPDAAGG